MGLIVENKNYIFTDKSLENIFYIKFIKKIFPNAKIIYCKRNILSSIMSIMQNNLTQISWAHNLDDIFKYFDIYFKEVTNLKKIYPDFVYELEYEKFVQDPETQSKNLLKFCDLPWSRKCLEFYKRKELISKTASNLQIRKSIYQDSMNKYLHYTKFFNNYKKKYSWFT